MRVNMMITKEKNNALICYEILSTHSLRKCMDISLENICKWMADLKVLSIHFENNVFVSQSLVSNH